MYKAPRPVTANSNGTRERERESVSRLEAIMTRLTYIMMDDATREMLYTAARAFQQTLRLALINAAVACCVARDFYCQQCVIGSRMELLLGVFSFSNGYSCIRVVKTNLSC